MPEVCTEYSRTALALRGAAALPASSTMPCTALPSPARPSPRLLPGRTRLAEAVLLTWVVFALNSCQLIHFNILAGSEVCCLLSQTFLKRELKMVLGCLRAELVLETCCSRAARRQGAGLSYLGAQGQVLRAQPETCTERPPEDSLCLRQNCTPPKATR